MTYGHVTKGDASAGCVQVLCTATSPSAYYALARNASC